MRSPEWAIAFPPGWKNHSGRGAPRTVGIIAHEVALAAGVASDVAARLAPRLALALRQSPPPPRAGRGRAPRRAPGDGRHLLLGGAGALRAGGGAPGHVRLRRPAA